MQLSEENQEFVMMIIGGSYSFLHAREIRHLAGIRAHVLKHYRCGTAPEFHRTSPAQVFFEYQFPSKIANDLIADWTILTVTICVQPRACAAFASFSRVRPINLLLFHWMICAVFLRNKRYWARTKILAGETNDAIAQCRKL